MITKIKKFLQSDKPRKNSRILRPSRDLVFHVHGGGFAAQTSKSHASYLRKWAVDLDVPIISIDYSLTPEAPFPRALEEVFYAYCWALKNAELLGSTGENIVLVGDSAGGNLITACTIKCIEMGIRKPKGLLNIFSALSLNFKDSPSRFFTIMDPILPFGFISRLVKEYASLRDENDKNLQNQELTNSKQKPKNLFKTPEEEFNVKVNEDYLVSPYNAPDEILAQFPPTKFVTANLDPCLDDCVEFAKKMKRVGVEVTFDLVKDLPHGFLYFSQVRTYMKT
jgi:hormone-sensitive lipase